MASRSMQVALQKGKTDPERPGATPPPLKKGSPDGKDKKSKMDFRSIAKFLGGSSKKKDESPVTAVEVEEKVEEAETLPEEKNEPAEEKEEPPAPFKFRSLAELQEVHLGKNVPVVQPTSSHHALQSRLEEDNKKVNDDNERTEVKHTAQLISRREEISNMLKNFDSDNEEGDMSSFAREVPVRKRSGNGSISNHSSSSSNHSRPKPEKSHRKKHDSHHQHHRNSPPPNNTAALSSSHIRTTVHHRNSPPPPPDISQAPPMSETSAPVPTESTLPTEEPSVGALQPPPPPIVQTAAVPEVSTEETVAPPAASTVDSAAPAAVPANSDPPVINSPEISTEAPPISATVNAGINPPPSSSFLPLEPQLAEILTRDLPTSGIAPGTPKLSWRTISCLAGAINARQSPTAKAAQSLLPPPGPSPMKVSAKPMPPPPLETLEHSLNDFNTATSSYQESSLSSIGDDDDDDSSSTCSSSMIIRRTSSNSISIPRTSDSVAKVVRWLNTLRIWPKHLSVSTLHSEMKSGMLLCAIAKYYRKNSKDRLSGLNKKAVTLRAARHNIESAFRSIVSSSRFPTSRLPAADDVFHGSKKVIYNLMLDIFTYVAVPSVRLKRVLHWMDIVLVKYGHGILEDDEEGGDLGAIQAQFQSGIRIWCIIHYYCADDNDNTSSRVDSRRIRQRIESKSEAIENLQEVMEVMKSLRIPCVFSTAHEFYNDEKYFLAMQLELLYKEFHRQGPVFPLGREEVIIHGLVFKEEDDNDYEHDYYKQDYKEIEKRATERVVQQASLPLALPKHPTTFDDQPPSVVTKRQQHSTEYASAPAVPPKKESGEAVVVNQLPKKVLQQLSQTLSTPEAQHTIKKKSPQRKTAKELWSSVSAHHLKRSSQKKIASTSEKTKQQDTRAFRLETIMIKREENRLTCAYSDLNERIGLVPDDEWCAQLEELDEQRLQLAARSKAHKQKLKGGFVFRVTTESQFDNLQKTAESTTHLPSASSKVQYEEQQNNPDSGGGSSIASEEEEDDNNYTSLKRRIQAQEHRLMVSEEQRGLMAQKLREYGSTSHGNTS